jgi:hypothetical protein
MTEKLDENRCRMDLKNARSLTFARTVVAGWLVWVVSMCVLERLKDRRTTALTGSGSRSGGLLQAEQKVEGDQKAACWMKSKTRSMV